MDESAIARARERIEQKADGAALDAVLQRARDGLETLTAAATETAEELSGRVESAVQESLREQARPVGRNLAEIRGLMNQVIRRIDTLEADAAADREARIDDLSLLVELISSGWRNVDARLGRLEALVARLEQGLQSDDGAVVYRIDDHRPDAASS